MFASLALAGFVLLGAGPRVPSALVDAQPAPDEADVAARRMVAEDGLTFVHPFDDPAVIAGQGTAGLEILEDLPDVETVYQRVSERDAKIGLATVYRTLRLFEEANILERHDFGDGRARYEEVPVEHHDHLIDIHSGKVIEFRNEAIEELQHQVAKELGYRIVDHRLELYAVPLEEEG